MKVFNFSDLASRMILLVAVVMLASFRASLAEAAVDREYIIGPGDILNVSVWKEEGMQREVLVKPDGGISFPLIGAVHAGGKTTEQLTDELVTGLKKFIPNPVVTVSVTKSVSNKIYIIGKVARPGEYVSPRYLDVLQALTLAGGLTPYADSDEIKVIRKKGSKTSIYLFDYDEVVGGENIRMNIMLEAGDTIVVP